MPLVLLLKAINVLAVGVDFKLNYYIFLLQLDQKMLKNLQQKNIMMLLSCCLKNSREFKPSKRLLSASGEPLLDNLRLKMDVKLLRTCRERSGEKETSVIFIRIV